MNSRERLQKMLRQDPDAALPARPVYRVAVSPPVIARPPTAPTLPPTPTPPVVALPPNSPMQRTGARQISQTENNTLIAPQKAKVFIGSSREGIRIAQLLQLAMDHDAEATVWSQGVFGLSSGTLESLVMVAPSFDFAVLVLTPDDVVISRDRTKNAPRDNVLFELGLFMGAIGRERTYIVHPRVQISLPSDLAGITPVTYEANRSDGNLKAALGSPSTELLEAIRHLGRRSRVSK